MINNLPFADDTTLMASSAEELTELFLVVDNTNKGVGLQNITVVLVDRQNNRLNIKKINKIKTADTFIYFRALTFNGDRSSQEMKRKVLEPRELNSRSFGKASK